MKMNINVLDSFILEIVIVFALGHHENSNLTLEERSQHLADFLKNETVFKFDGKKFKDYVEGSPRNYSMIVMFTAAAPQRQCDFCEYASDQFEIVANSFRYSKRHSEGLYFARVDFDDESEVFDMMKIDTAPVFMHFPPEGKSESADTMDIFRVGVSAEEISNWIFQRTDIRIHITKPPNFEGTISVIILLTFSFAFLYFRKENFDFIYDRNIWGILALSFCFMMVSGQMWNSIRDPPFLHVGLDGGIALVHWSPHGQFIVETYIVMIFNAAVVIGMILLTEAVRGNRNANVTNVMAVTGVSLVSTCFFLLLLIFMSKFDNMSFSE